MDYTLALPALDDAWGRGIAEDNELSFNIPATVTAAVDFTRGSDKITTLSSGTIDAVIDIQNSGAAFSAEIVAAVCKNGKFTAVTGTPVTVSKGKTTQSVSISAGATDDAVQIFVLKKSGSLLVPVCPVTALTEQGIESRGY